MVEKAIGRDIGDIKKEQENVDSSKEVMFGASSSSISDSSCGSALPRLASIQGRTTGPTRRSTKGGWTQNEDATLTKAVNNFNGKNWKKIAEFFPGRSDVQCLHRWQKVLNPELVKGPWTKEEDDLIVDLVEKNGAKKWSHIAKSLPGRIGKQCRERWHNHLNPDIKKDAWTREEEIILIQAHKIYGNKWAEIARFIPGRADNSIKNHWNCSVKKRVESDSVAGVAEDQCGIRCCDFYSPKEAEESRNSETLGSWNRSETLKKLFTQQPLQTESPRFLKEEVPSLMILPKGIQCDGKSTSEHCGGVVNSNACKSDDRCSTVPIWPPLSCALSTGGDSSRFSDSHKPTPGASSLRPPSNISLDLTLSCKSTCKPPDLFLPPTTRLFESPKRPCHHPSSPMNGSSSMDPRFNTEFDNPFSSFSAREFGNGNVQVCTPRRSAEANFSLSCNDQSQMQMSDIFENGGLTVESAKSPVCCTTPPSTRSNGVNDGCTSPESILRKAAKSFKNTPSIIRKRPRQTSKNVNHGDDSDEICTPEARTGSSGGTHSASCSWQKSQSHEDCLNSTNLNVKWLSLSSPNCMEFEPTSIKSVEKRLEFEFDMEWENSRGKGSTSVTASDSSNSFHIANVQLMPFDESPNTESVPSDESPNSLRVGSKDLFGSFLLHKFGDNCNSET